MQYVDIPLADEVIRFVQSAEAADMQQKVDLLLAEFVDADVTSFELAGAGDGHTFIARFGFASTNPPTSIFEARAFFYMAADKQHLALARASVLPSVGTIVDEPFAGASKGTRFMGAILTGGRQS